MPCTATRSPARGCGIAKRVIEGNSGAHQRRSFVCRQLVGYSCNRLGRDHHVFRVAAIEADCGNFFKLTENEIASTAGVTLEAMSAVPAHPHPLTGLPLGNVRPN